MYVIEDYFQDEEMLGAQYLDVDSFSLSHGTETSWTIYS